MIMKTTQNHKLLLFYKQIEVTFSCLKLHTNIITPAAELVNKFQVY